MIYVQRIRLDGTRPGSLGLSQRNYRINLFIATGLRSGNGSYRRRWVREEEQDQTFRSSHAIRLASSGRCRPYPERTALPAIDLQALAQELRSVALPSKLHIWPGQVEKMSKCPLTRRRVAFALSTGYPRAKQHRRSGRFLLVRGSFSSGPEAALPKPAGSPLGN